MMRERPDVDEMDEPPNVPDDLEEKADRVFSHVGGTTRNPKLYHYPMQEDNGPKDYELILELIRIDEAGAIFELYDRRYVVLGSSPVGINWPGEVSWQGARVQAASFGHKHEPDGSTRTWRPGKDRPTPIDLWEAFLYEDLEVIGHVEEI